MSLVADLVEHLRAEDGFAAGVQVDGPFPPTVDANTRVGVRVHSPTFEPSPETTRRGPTTGTVEVVIRGRDAADVLAARAVVLDALQRFPLVGDLTEVDDESQYVATVSYRMKAEQAPLN